MKLPETFTSEIGKAVVSMVTGTALAQVINFAFSIYLSRIFLPSDFGAVAVFTSVLSFILVVSSGKFDVALVAAKENEDAKKLFTLSFVINLIISTLSLLAAALIYWLDIPILMDTPAREWLYFFPLSVFLFTGSQIFWMWMVRKKEFGGLATVRVLEALGLNITSILLKSWGAIGLFLGTISSQIISFICLLFLYKRKEPDPMELKDVQNLEPTFEKYSEFPKVNILQGFIDIFQVNAVILFTTGFFAADIIGFYALCMRVLQVPMRLIVLPVSHVFFARASELHREGQSLEPLVKKTMWKVALVAAPLTVILLLIGPWLFSFVFGEKWNEAGVYAQLLAGWIFVDLVRAPVVQIASILGKQRGVLFISVIANVVLIGTLLLGIHYYQSPRLTFGLVSLTQGLMTLVLLIYVLRISKMKS